MDKIELIRRIFRTQVKRYISQILIIFLFILISAVATTSVAWLLDPAIKKIFIEKNATLLMVIIPWAIYQLLAFCNQVNLNLYYKNQNNKNFIQYY